MAFKVAGCLFSYAIPGFELCENVAHKPNFSIFYVLQALTDAFVGIGVSGDVPQLLILNVIFNSHDSSSSLGTF
jgi:hypothetical protein